MTAETLAAIWEAIITTYDEFAIGFSLEPEKVKDRSVDLELPRAFWAMPRVTVRWVAGTGAYDQTFEVNILFLGQTASDRTADTATGTHSDMAIAAQRCLERFIDLYVNGDTLFMGEVVNIERIGAGTLSPIIDEDTTQLTGVNLRIDVTVRASECAAEYFDGIPSETADCDAATVTNSDDSYMHTVASGATLELPDVTHTDSDGTEVVLPAMTPFEATLCEGGGPCEECPECDPATAVVKNSAGTVLETEEIPSGGSEDIVLPDVTHTDSDGSPVTLPGMEPFVATPCGPGDDAHVLINQTPVIDLGPGETWDLHVEYPDGTQVGSWNAGAERWEIPACPACDDATAVVKNTAGTTLDTEAIPSGGTEDIIIGDVVITIEDTASTVINVANAPSGEPYTVVAPDAKYQLKDSAGVNIGSPGLIVSQGDANITAPDATYQLKDSAGTNIGGPGAIVSNGSANITAPDGTVKTTDGVTTVAAVKSNGTANLPQSVIKYKDAANADQITAASNTEYSGGTLRPATQVPRRALTLDGTPTGDYVTVADLIANTVPDVTSTPAVRAITASWAAGDDETIPVALPAEYQGITYAYVSNTGSNGTITVSVDGGSTFAAPPFTVGASGVAFRRTTYSGAGSVLYEE